MARRRKRDETKLPAPPAAPAAPSFSDRLFGATDRHFAAQQDFADRLFTPLPLFAQQARFSRGIFGEGEPSARAAAPPTPQRGSFLDRNAQFTSLAALRALTQPPVDDRDRRRF
jgi:hypothetical protein